MPITWAWRGSSGDWNNVSNWYKYEGFGTNLIPENGDSIIIEIGEDYKNYQIENVPTINLDMLDINPGGLPGDGFVKLKGSNSILLHVISYM